MKKIFFLFLIITVISLSGISVYAGSIPEDLLHSDDAEIFFAEVLSYHSKSVTLSPVKKIKGDVKTGTKQNYANPNTVGDFKIKPGNVYLFTYFDENNPTDIFEVTSYDTKTLKLKNTTGDMWERFEKYLNEGKYEIAEQNRIDKQNEVYVTTGEQISLTDYVGADRAIPHATVSFYSGPNAFEIDKGDFLKIADTIILEKIEASDAQIENWHGIYLSAAESRGFAFISADGKVSRNNPTHSMLLPCEYIIKAADIAKLYTLMPDSAQKNLPPLKNPIANFWYWVIDNPQTALVCAVLVSVVLVFSVTFVIAYKVRKKRGI